MPRGVKKVIENPNDDYGMSSGYEDPLEYMTPEQIALLADYCQYLNAHDGFDPDNYEDVILEKERQLLGRGRTKSNGPPPLYPEESDESEEDEDEEPEEEPDEDIEEENNDNSYEEN